MGRTAMRPNTNNNLIYNEHGVEEIFIGRRGSQAGGVEMVYVLTW